MSRSGTWIHPPWMALGCFLLPKIPLKPVNLLSSFVSPLQPGRGQHVASVGGQRQERSAPHLLLPLTWPIFPTFYGTFLMASPRSVTRVAFPARMGTHLPLPALNPIDFFSFPSQFPPPRSLLEISPGHPISESCGVEGWAGDAGGPWWCRAVAGLICKKGGGLSPGRLSSNKERLPVVKGRARGVQQEC